MHGITHGQIFTTEGATLRAFHSPGHTDDHMSFILPEESALFTGDNVLGHGTAVFDNLAVYLASLSAMAHETTGKGYPGHGAVLGSATDRIREYISHRAARERQVLDVLGRKAEGKGWGVLEIVRLIYVDTPESLYPAAARGVGQILEKLLAEGRVRYLDGDDVWTLVDGAVL